MVSGCWPLCWVVSQLAHLMKAIEVSTLVPPHMALSVLPPCLSNVLASVLPAPGPSNPAISSSLFCRASSLPIQSEPVSSRAVPDPAHCVPFGLNWLLAF